MVLKLKRSEGWETLSFRRCRPNYYVWNLKNNDDYIPGLTLYKSSEYKYKTEFYANVKGFID